MASKKKKEGEKEKRHSFFAEESPVKEKRRSLFGAGKKQQSFLDDLKNPFDDSYGKLREPVLGATGGKTGGNKKRGINLTKSRYYTFSDDEDSDSDDGMWEESELDLDFGESAIGESKEEKEARVLTLQFLRSAFRSTSSTSDSKSSSASSASDASGFESSSKSSSLSENASGEKPYANKMLLHRYASYLMPIVSANLMVFRGDGKTKRLRPAAFKRQLNKRWDIDFAIDGRGKKKDVTKEVENLSGKAVC
jgi:hypothetical protein